MRIVGTAARLQMDRIDLIGVTLNAPRPTPANTSAAGLRAHADLHLIVPRMNVSAVEPLPGSGLAVRGSTKAYAGDLWKSIADAGYVRSGSIPSRNPNYPQYIDHVYRHPDGHELVVEKQGHAEDGGPWRRVEYRPSPASTSAPVDPMSAAADRASLAAHAAHRTHRDVVESYVPDVTKFPQYKDQADRKAAAVAAVSAHHLAAARDHGIARDKAAEDDRHQDVTRHERLIAHHEAEARRLDPESTPNANARRPTGDENYQLLGFGRTAATVEPAGRTAAGAFRPPRAPAGRTTDNPIMRDEQRETLAAADERAHGELHSLVPRLTVTGFYGAQLGAPDPMVHGHTELSAGAVTRHLTGYGYRDVTPTAEVTSDRFHDRQQPGGQTTLMEHPHFGHRVEVVDYSAHNLRHPAHGLNTSVTYTPKFEDDHPDDMSRAADASSLRAHIKTGLAAEQDDSSVTADAAGYHLAAARDHYIARDKAEDDPVPRPADAARHVAMAKYHEAVAHRLDPRIDPGRGAVGN